MALGDCLLPELEGFLLHPVRIPIVRKRTRRRLLSSRHSTSVPVYPDPRVAGKGILWRGHTNQGRCQPGRRAVLEETKCPSDRKYSTLNTAFSQVQTLAYSSDRRLIFNKIQHGVLCAPCVLGCVYSRHLWLAMCNIP